MVAEQAANKYDKSNRIYKHGFNQTAARKKNRPDTWWKIYQDGVIKLSCFTFSSVLKNTRQESCDFRDGLKDSACWSETGKSFLLVTHPLCIHLQESQAHLDWSLDICGDQFGQAAEWMPGADLALVQADRGSYTWKWIPLEQVIFITAPFRLSSVIRRIIPSAIRGGLHTHTSNKSQMTGMLQSHDKHWG